MICIEIADTGARVRIEREVWITSNRNGPVITPHRIKAKGVGDGHQIWSLGEQSGLEIVILELLLQKLQKPLESVSLHRRKMQQTREGVPG